MLGQRAEEAGRAGVWRDVGQAEVRWSGPVAWGVRSGLGRILGLGWVEGLGLGFYSSPFSFSFLFLFPFLSTQNNLNSNEFEFKLLYKQTKQNHAPA